MQEIVAKQRVPRCRCSK